MAKGQKSLWFLVSAHVASDPRVTIFNFQNIFFAMKRCPIEAKIAGSIGIMPCCAFSHGV